MTQVTLSPQDEVRFQELMNASYKKVFNLAYRLSNDRSDAEDLTQDAYFRAYRGFEAYQGDRPFENWILRIVTRLYLDMKRSRSRRVQTVSSDAPLRSDSFDDTVHFETADKGPSPEQVIMMKEVSPELEASLAELTGDQRRLIWMADVEGIPYQEIADHLGSPVGTIRSRLHRAHKLMRELLTKHRAGTRLAA